jgi:general secretion pathway protein L
MIAEFLTWWVGQLKGLIPADLAAGSRGDACIAELSDRSDSLEIVLWWRAQGKETRIGVFSLAADGIAGLLSALPVKRPRMLLRVSADLLLERQVVLPAATERDWPNVLRYEMDRLTPFSADQLFWKGRIERRDSQRGTLTLWLSVIRKAALLPYITALAAIGLAPAAIETIGAGKPVIDLQSDRPVAWRRDPVRWLLCGCAALAVIAIILPFIGQSYRQAQVAQDIRALQPDVTQAEALLRHRSADAATANVFSMARQQVGDPLAVLAAVTNALPDDSFLTQLTLNHLQLNIAGQSTAAAPLLAALSAYPTITDVTFSAPVTRDSESHKDLFAIQAAVRSP